MICASSWSTSLCVRHRCFIGWHDKRCPSLRRLPALSDAGIDPRLDFIGVPRTCTFRRLDGGRKALVRDELVDWRARKGHCRSRLHNERSCSPVAARARAARGRRASRSCAARQVAPMRGKGSDRPGSDIRVQVRFQRPPNPLGMPGRPFRPPDQRHRVAASWHRPRRSRASASGTSSNTPSASNFSLRANRYFRRQ
jgi:hypothetical protein